MIFYSFSILIALVAFFASFTKYDKKLASLLYFSILLLVLIITPKGNDYFNYIEISLDSERIKRIELISRWFLSIYSRIDIIDLFFTTQYLIFFLFFYKFLIKTKSLNGFNLFLFITFPLLYLKSFDLVRQYSATAIIIYAFSLIKDDKLSNLKFFLLATISFLMHNTSIVFALAVIFCKVFKILKIKTNNLWIYSIILFPIIYIASINFKKIISQNEDLLTTSYYNNYLLDNNDNGFKIYILYIILSIFTIFSTRNLIDESDKKYCWMLFIGMIAFSFSAPFGEHLSRVFIYFLFFIFPLTKYFSSKSSVKILFLLPGIIFYLYLVYLKPELLSINY